MAESEMAMPKQSPVPEEFDRPYCDALNEDRLLLQYCPEDDRWQYPPETMCQQCGGTVEWREIGGHGHIYSYAVVYDTPVVSLQPDLPFNCAVISLDDAEEILFLSHLPGTPVDEVPIGAPVRLIFETTPATGQKVPEWVVDDSELQGGSHGERTDDLPVGCRDVPD
jgi:uncharacterized protein